MASRQVSTTVLTLLLTGSYLAPPLAAQEQAPLLTSKQIMNGLIVPATSTIWGAYQLSTPQQWTEVENAALAVIAAGELLVAGGSDEQDQLSAKQEKWQADNQAMITAAQEVLKAVSGRDEERLSAVGNDLLYPPCESCHQSYQAR